MLQCARYIFYTIAQILQMKLFNKLTVFCFCVMLFVSLCSWGFLVHRTIQQLAVYELPKTLRSFFYKNMDGLVKNSTRPDERRNKDTTEATKHFIDLEAYEVDSTKKMPLYWSDAVATYTKDSLLKYGYVPYHVVAMKEKLTQAFKEKNIDNILFYAADIGHYIQDAHVPLHTSINYDGQLTNQKGLHALWESVVPEIELNNYTLSSKHKASYLPNVNESIWVAIRNANMLLKDVFDKEIEVTKQFVDTTKYRIQIRRGKEVKYYTTAFAKAYSKALEPTINNQLIASANLTADFWYTAWVDAGKPDLDIELTTEQKANLKQQRKAFKKNTLIENKLLISKKDAKNEE